jgi:N-acylglucosamine-6-phosphate 2-epimerase
MDLKLLPKLKGGLIVSCQARPGNPMRGARIMAAFAQAAFLGGAVGLRANGSADVRAIRHHVDLPIIGINKLRNPRYPVYITPTVSSAATVVRAGADIIAIDATHRPRRGGLSPEELIEQIHDTLNCLVMADIDTLQSGLAAAKAGADIIATTLAGYTDGRPTTVGPDLQLVAELAARLTIPVICEGRIRNPEDVAAAFAAGAYAVVVGTQITNPMEITRTFVNATPGYSSQL